MAVGQAVQACLQCGGEIKPVAKFDALVAGAAKVQALQVAMNQIKTRKRKRGFLIGLCSC